MHVTSIVNNYIHFVHFMFIFDSNNEFPSSKIHRLVPYFVRKGMKKREISSMKKVANQTGSKNKRLIKNKYFEFKNSWGCLPPHSNYMGAFIRFRRTFAEVITFGEASLREF